MSEWNYIVAAYSVTWIVLLGYATYLTVRARARGNVESASALGARMREE